MSIFSNIFGGGEKSKASSNKNTNIKWILLNALEQLETIKEQSKTCLLYTSPSPRDRQKSRMPSSA